MPGSSSTKAPKSATRVTVPCTRSPALYFSLDQVPRMRLQLLHAERNAPLGGIHLEHLDLDLLAHRQHVGGLVDAAPGNVGDVQQRVHAADIHESAVIGQAADRAVHGLAFLDLGVAAFLGGALFFFEHGAAVHHHVFIGHVELDDAAADLLADQLLHLGGVWAPLREAGMKARTPTSTLTPPLTTAVTMPAMAALSAKAFSSDDQSLGRSTLMRESS